MKSALIVLGSTVFMIVGCVSPAPTVFIREVPVRAVSSTNSLDVIRFPASYRAYTVGRRIDPHNPGMMSEAHVLYVRESSDRCNLSQPNSSPSLPLPATAQADGVFAPLPLDQVIRSEIQEQRRVSQGLQEKTRSFEQAVDVFVPAAKKAVELSGQLKERQQQLDERLRRLEEVQRWSQSTSLPPSAGTNR